MENLATGELLLFVGGLLLLVTLGVQFMRGKWLVLIAGYDGGQRVNSKKLGSAIGQFCLFVALLILLTYLLEFPTWVLLVGTVILVFVGIFRGNQD